MMRKRGAGARFFIRLANISKPASERLSALAAAAGSCS